jgi:hypothetical protein
MMAIDPACSDMTRLPKKDELGCHFAMGRNAYEANRQVGERMVADEVEYIGNKVKELLVEYDNIKPKHTFRTYDDVERFWDEKIKPIIKDFACLKLDFSGQGRTIPEDSVWFENWQSKG